MSTRICRIGGVVALALLAIMNGCTPSTPPPSEETTATAPAAETNAPEEKAKALVHMMVARDFEGVSADFDATMKTSLPPSVLAATWTQLEKQAGTYQQINSATVAQEKGYEVVYVNCQFEQTALNAKVVYSADGLVAGLFFLP